MRTSNFYISKCDVLLEMSTREGVTRTGREAKMCKVSATDALHSRTTLNSQSTRKQTPLVNRVYDIRMKLVQTATKEACIAFKFSQRYQILIMGSGQDSNYDSYGSENSLVYLVDFPEVITERKQSVSSAFVRTIGVDMTRTSELMLLLQTEGFDFALPTVVVFECVLCYISEPDSSSLLSRLASTLSQCIVISYDPVLKSMDHHVNALSAHMRDKFASRGAPLLSSSHSVSHRMDHFLQSHWTYVSCLNLNHAARLWLTEEEQSVPLSEPFDEYTSLVAIHNHYAMTIASPNKEMYISILRGLRSRSEPVDRSDAVLRLYARITSAESQLESIERAISKLVASRVQSSDTSPYRIRQANNSMSSAISSLYTKVVLCLQLLCLFTSIQGFEEVALKYASVRKFVKSNAKILQDVEKHFSDSKGGVFFVAEVDDVVVGCVGCIRKEGRAELSHLSVSAKYQNMGIGKALVSQVLFCSLL